MRFIIASQLITRSPADLRSSVSLCFSLLPSPYSTKRRLFDSTERGSQLRKCDTIIHLTVSFTARYSQRFTSGLSYIFAKFYSSKFNFLGLKRRKHLDSHKYSQCDYLINSFT